MDEKNLRTMLINGSVAGIVFVIAAWFIFLFFEADVLVPTGTQLPIYLIASSIALISSIIFFLALKSFADRFNLDRLFCVTRIGGIGFFTTYQVLLFIIFSTGLWTTSLFMWHVIPVMTPVIGVVFITLGYVMRKLKNEFGEIANVISVIGVSGGALVVILIHTILISRILGYPESFLILERAFYFMSFFVLTVFYALIIFLFIKTIRSIYKGTNHSV